MKLLVAWEHAAKYGPRPGFTDTVRSSMLRSIGPVPAERRSTEL